MNVASLELCKELYELSGWKPQGDSENWYIVEPAHKDTEGMEHEEFSYLAPYESHAKKEWGQYAIPAYDLGYLLRKLPEHSAIIKLEDNKYMSAHDELSDLDVDALANQMMADIPEDAACKLCCELIRQGIIKP